MRTAIAAILLAAASPAFAQPTQPPSAGAALTSPDGSEIGSATLREGPEGIVLRIETQGLTPGWHGLHFHMVGDCSDGSAGFKKSGAHVGHEEGGHGLLNPHGPEEGDLPNLFVGGDGSGKGEFYVADVRIGDFADADGTAIIVHANEDDHASQPIGSAGGRVACGTIGIAK